MVQQRELSIPVIIHKHTDKYHRMSRQFKSKTQRESPKTFSFYLEWKMEWKCGLLVKAI